MKMIPLLLVLFLSVLFTGCIKLPGVKQPSLQEIDNWVASKQYGKALNALKTRQQKQASPGLEDKIMFIENIASSFDRNQSKLVNALIDQHHLLEARKKLNTALASNPEGKQLNEVRERLNDIQRTKISRLQAQQLLSKAEWLLRARAIQKSLTAIKPDDANGEDNSNIIATQIQNTAGELYHLGLKALQKGDFELADSCLIMSDRLLKNSLTTSAIARLEQLRSLKKKKDVRKRQASLKKKRVLEIKEYKKYKEQQLAARRYEFNVIYYKTLPMLKDNQLSAAKANLEKLNLLFPENKKLIPMNEEFARKLPKHIEALQDRGRQLYINGKIRQARNIWKKALTLDPGNKQISDSIARANRVLEKLDELKKKNNTRNKGVH